MNITKYKKLIMMEHKLDMSITKINKYKKNLNSTSTAEYKTNMNIKNWKTEHHFYKGTLNRTQLNFVELFFY